MKRDNQTDGESPRHPQPNTQAYIVLECLIEAKGQRLPAHELGSKARSIAIHSVVSGLRLKYGWNIINEKEYVTIEGRSICHSFYRLPIDPLEGATAHN